MKRYALPLIMLAVLLMPSTGIAAGKKNQMTVVAGTSVPRLGMAFDTSYDPRFDEFIPGYKIVQLAIVNNSFNLIPMDPKRDEYAVLTAGGRKHYKAFADLRYADPKAWKELPERARKIIAYPLVLPIGARQVIDLFVPSSTPLEGFRGIVIDIKELDTKIELIAND